MKLVYFLFLVLIVACSTNTKKKGTQAIETKINYKPPIQIVINNLHDSLKPRVTQLKNVPKPTTVIAEISTTHHLSTSFLISDSTKLIAHPEAQGKGLFTTFTSKDGLAMNAISWGQGSVFVDKQGNLWFATQGGGVSKYDGESFITYTTEQGLANNTVLCITQDQKGNIWFGTDGGGVSKYDGECFINYTTEQGLANNYVLSIVQDENQNIWMGTDGGGVSKYDGEITNSCREKSCNHNMSVREDIEKHKKNSSKSFTTYTTKHGLANNYVMSIAQGLNGNLWFGTADGVSKFDVETANSCIESEYFQDLGIKEDPDKYQKCISKSFTTYSTDQGLVNNYVRSIIQDKNGNIWMGTYGGVSKYNLDNATPCSEGKCKHDLRVRKDLEKHNKNTSKSFTTYIINQDITNNNVLSIAQDKNGNLWMGTNGGGISKYDGQSFTNYTTDQGLVNNTVFGVAQDKNGNIWMGTYGGISKYDGQSFTTYTTAQGLTNNTIFSITQDQSKNLWMGTNGGVSKYDGEGITSYTTNEGLVNNTVFSITQDKSGSLWMGTNGGISKYDTDTNGTDGHFTSYTTEQGLVNNSVRCIIQDKTGNLWMGTNGGVSKYNGESFTSYTIDQGLANNYVFCMAQDESGSIWMGTYGGGVSKYNPNTNKADESFTTYTTEQGLANNTVFSIAQDHNGNLWFGTYGGGINIITKDEITKLSDKKDTVNAHKVVFLTLNTTNGLPDNGISAIRFNSKGDAIIGTNFGLYILTYKEVKEVIATAKNLKPIGKIGQVYNQFNGYPIKDVNTGQNNGAMLIDTKDILWVGHGSNGLTRVDMDAIHKNNEAPIVKIKNVLLKNENVCYYSLNRKTDSLILNQQEVTTYNKVFTQQERDSLKKHYQGVRFDGITKWYHLPQNLVLPYQHNALTFEYNAIETDRNYLVNYKYMLKGSDKSWGPITKKKEATYTNLEEGNYTFLLKAQSPWGVWSQPVEFNFTVLPSWYRTWWAYLCYTSITILAIWLLISMQIKKLKQHQAELEIEVEDSTQEIRQQKEKVEKAHKEITDSINYAERIQHSFLATNNLLNDNLDDYFVLFKPKDIVSGDFYWVDTLSNGNFVMINADSTGHGVPGAIMSILNISSIELAIERGNLNPAAIFNSARQTIIERLNKDGSKYGGKDGMDASIICFDFKNLKMAYCAAQNPIWIIRNGELIQIKPEKMPIGKHDYDHIPFIGGEFQLQKGDQIYTLTDGFQDQFGGPKDKKFMVKRMRQFVLDNSYLPMVEQQKKLEEALSNWMRNSEQIDDICIIGIRI